MGELLTPTHLMLVAGIAFVLFGGNKLAELGKGMGAGFSGVKDGIKGQQMTAMVRANQPRLSYLNQASPLISLCGPNDFEPELTLRGWSPGQKAGGVGI
jgi:TatA/E family protein of Tat protein translocase